MTGGSDDPSSKPTFVYRRRVAFYETDAMAVVHHANYIRLFEEARVEWLRDRQLMDLHHPYGPLVFAVTELSNRFHRPARFDDELEVWTEARRVRSRLEFRYALWSVRLKEVIADGTTTLVPLNAEFRAVRLPLHAQEVFQRERWSEVWPPQPRS